MTRLGSMRTRAELAAFGAFLCKPVRRPGAGRDGHALSRWVLALALLLLLDTLIIVPLDVVSSTLGITNVNADMGPWKFFFLGVLIAPPLEELLFRAGLRSPTYSLFIGPGLIAATMAGRGRHLAMAVALLVFSLAARLYIARRQRRVAGAAVQSSRAYLRNYRLSFYAYALAFAVVHISNMTVPSAAGWLAVPLLFLPQLYFGIVAGYLRLRDGLPSSILLHMAANFYLLMLALVVG